MARTRKPNPVGAGPAGAQSGFSREQAAPGGPGGKAGEVIADGRISELLVEAGLVSEAQYRECHAARGKDSGGVIDALVRSGYLAPSKLVEFLFAHPGSLGLDTSRLEISPDLVALLTPALARKHEVLPIDKVGGVLLVGAAHPLSETAIDEIGEDAGLRPRVVLCAREDIHFALDSYYEATDRATVAEDDPAVAQKKVPAGEDLQTRTQQRRGRMKLFHVASLIRRVSSLPALPETVTRVKEVMDDPTSAIDDVVNIITLDPTVAAKILSVANSAAYGFPHKINDIGLAVSLLGLRETYDIVLSVVVADFVHKFKHFDYRAFWLESICCAAAARIVAKAHGKRHAPGVFAAGLLHDLGRAVLLELQPNFADGLRPGLFGRDLVAEEERVIGLAHTEAGYQLANQWNLPPDIAEPMRFHHAPELATQARFHVAVVALANVMAYAPGATLEENPDLFSGFEDTLAFLHLDAEVAEAMLEEYLVLREGALREASR